VWKAVPHHIQKENCGETPEKEMPSQRASSNSCSTSNEMPTYIGSKSSRWLAKRVDKAKESLRLSREDDDRAYKAMYAKLVVKRAELKEGNPSPYVLRRIDRISKQLKHAKPVNSTKTVGMVDNLHALKKAMRKLRKQANGNSELALAWSRTSGKRKHTRAAFTSSSSTPSLATEVESEVEVEAEVRPFAEKRKKKMRVLLPEDE